MYINILKYAIKTKTEKWKKYINIWQCHGCSWCYTPHREPSNPHPIHSLFFLSLSPLSRSHYLSHTLQFANPTLSLSIFDAHLSIQPYLSRSRFPFPFSHFLLLLLLLFRSVFRISSVFPNSDNPELDGDGRRQGQSPRRSLLWQALRFPQRWFDLIWFIPISIRAFFFRVSLETHVFIASLAIIARSVESQSAIPSACQLRARQTSLFMLVWLWILLFVFVFVYFFCVFLLVFFCF